MKRRPETLKEGYGWCEKDYHGSWALERFGVKIPACPRCKEEKKRTLNGQCNAKLHHGPGHQSSTFCEETGDHDIHMCHYYPSGCYETVARWTEDHKFSGFFDEPPDVEEE